MSDRSGALKQKRSREIEVIMKLHFTFLLLIAAIMLIGWTIVNFAAADYAQNRLDELTSYPLLAYVADSTAAVELTDILIMHPAVDRVSVQSGFDASQELIESHALNISADLLSKFNLPDIVHIHLKSAHSAIEQRDSLLVLIQTRVHPDDVESHPALWERISRELHLIKKHSLYLNGFIAVLMLFLVVFMRLNYENWLARLRPLRKRTVVDELREKRAHIRHIVMMMFVPPALSPLLYYLLLYLNKISVFLEWWVFVLQLLVFVIASVVVIISEQTSKHSELLLIDDAPEHQEPEPERSKNNSPSDETLT